MKMLMPLAGLQLNFLLVFNRKRKVVHMKRVTSSLVVCSLLLALTACSNESKLSSKEYLSESAENVEDSGKAQEESSKGYLPTKIENIEDGGSIPEGSEAKASLEEGDYDISSFWGSWVLKGSNVSEVHATDHTFEYEVENESGERKILNVENFPKSFRFYPANLGGSLALWNLQSEARTKNIFSDGEKSASYEDAAEIVPIEQTLENMGYGVGAITLQGKEDIDDIEKVELIAYGGRVAVYTISDNTLAVGLLDASCDTSGSIEKSLEESCIVEIDYELSWNGCELSLTYDGETAIYVPENIEEGNAPSLEYAGLVDDFSPVDDIYGISVDPPSSVSKVIRDSHEGYVDTSISFDGSSMTIGNKVYPYAYSGNSLTIFTDDGGHSVYSNYYIEMGAGNNLVSANFYIGEEEFRNWETVNWFIERGFTTDLDLNQAVHPYAVTDNIVLNYNGTEITMKVNNPYTEAVPLQECYVCYVLLDDTESVAWKGDSTIGKTSYSDIEQFYEAAYEKKPDSLRYKTSYRGGIITDVSKPNWDYTQALELGDYEVIYSFENDVLKDVRIERPSLLYNGLQDNVDYDVLQNMNAATMTGVMQTRDDVLSRLKTAFADAGISVAVNESTGEIVMDTNVLFGYDSTELLSDGKEYIDSFMGVYASVILDDSLKDIISEIRFEGHTDSNGSYDYNLELSQKRADAVLAYCLSGDASSLNRDQKERLNAIASTIGYSYANLVYDSNGIEDADASRRAAIKFYINVSENAEISETDEANDMPDVANQLSAEDFILTQNGEVFNVFEKLKSKSALYLYYNSAESTRRENVAETARGIHIGDSVNDVISKYGDTDRYLFDTDNPLYSADDYRSAMSDECQSFLMYEDASGNMILFFLDEWECVSWIVYYME